MKLLNSSETANKLVELIQSHCNISFAVAWAKEKNIVFEALKNSSDKIVNSVIGTHSHLTDVEVLEWCFKVKPKIRFRFDTSKWIFHPKVYVFWSKEGWDVLIGSANLTLGGMLGNVELMLHVSSSECADKTLFTSVREKIAKYWENYNSKDMNEELLDSYREDSELKARVEHEIRRSSRSRSKAPDLLGMDWSEFFSLVRSEKFKDQPKRNPLEERLKLLRKSQQLFQSHRHFADMDEDDRRSIAATIGIGRGQFEHIEIGWFGLDMQRVGNFSDLIKSPAGIVSEALEYIPRTGEVFRENYRNYIHEIKKGFGDNPQGLAPVTRLIALKRPDIFIPWNNKNKKQLTRMLDLEHPLAPRDYRRYWDEVIARIYEDARWYNSDRPNNGHEADVWDFRAAMVDALTYIETKND
ncbi:MAG: phospholipase D family protein [Gammaproteobacteria bacterium]|nr:phospholipase D family protein [Gammaproteobacteria bacterium]MDE0252759.1 phospholipase D family protein [Gammaproteobacteria bacterium]